MTATEPMFSEFEALCEFVGNTIATHSAKIVHEGKKRTSINNGQDEIHRTPEIHSSSSWNSPSSTVPMADPVDQNISATLVELTRHRAIEGDDHMIFSVKNHPQYIVRVTKPRANRGYSGLEMATREGAVIDFFRSAYLSRGLPGGIFPTCIASLVLPSCSGSHGASRHDDETYVAEVCIRLLGKTLDEMPPSEKTLGDFASLMGVMKAAADDAEQFEMKLTRLTGAKAGPVRVPRIEIPDLIDLRREAAVLWKELVRSGDFKVNQQLPRCMSVSSEDPEDGFGWEDAEGLFERKTAFVDEIRDDLVATAQNGEAEMVFVHNDIKGEHILVDDQTGSITGILDWADAGFGNPAIDIEGLVLTVGQKAATTIAMKAGYGEVTILRGILLARCRCVTRLHGRLRGLEMLDAPVDLLKQQLRTSLLD